MKGMAGLALTDCKMYSKIYKINGCEFYLNSHLGYRL